jgi:predicted extracellular nuclease
VPSSFYVAWWNVENLFDAENAPPERRSDKVARAIGKDLKGWSARRRNRKVAQLASVIAQMNGGTGPDLLGVCEVENRFVLDLLAAAVTARLPHRRYQIVHADTSDARGIDVAFMYDPTRLQVPDDATFFHVVMRRNATREIVQINFVTAPGGRTWAVFGNHWPSAPGAGGSRPGTATSRVRRSATSTTGLEVHGPATPVLVMATSTMNRSTPRWSCMPAAPGSGSGWSAPTRAGCGT